MYIQDIPCHTATQYLMRVVQEGERQCSNDGTKEFHIGKQERVARTATGFEPINLVILERVFITNYYPAHRAPYI